MIPSQHRALTVAQRFRVTERMDGEEGLPANSLGTLFHDNPSDRRSK